jgi:hypothetical protein
MPKRFTDTDKWRDEWFGSLSNDHRIVWQYLLDNCTQAGIFKKDWRLLRFQCNCSITEAEFKEVFKGRVIDRGNFYFIPKFLKFQNKKGLNSNKPAIVSIREELEQNNLIETVREQLGNHFLIIKGKGMGTDKGLGEDMDKVTGMEEFEEAKEQYPEPVDLRKLDSETVKKAADLTDALCNYFQVRTVVTSVIYNSVCDFVTTISHRNEIDLCILALQNYMKYKARSQEQRHSILKWIGTKAEYYRDGQWTMIDWDEKNKSYIDKPHRGMIKQKANIDEIELPRYE